MFVAAVFRDRAAADTDDGIRAAAAVGLLFILLEPHRGVAARLERGPAARGPDEDGARDLGHRPHAPDPRPGRDEVSQLAATFNEMLDRLEHGFGAQREFLDDAGHELRTPLTIIRGHLELLGDDPVERQETLALVSDELDRMGRMVDDLLCSRARSSRTSST